MSFVTFIPGFLTAFFLKKEENPHIPQDGRPPACGDCLNSWARDKDRSAVRQLRPSGQGHSCQPRDDPRSSFLRPLALAGPVQGSLWKLALHLEVRKQWLCAQVCLHYVTPPVYVQRDLISLFIYPIFIPHPDLVSRKKN